MPKGPKQPSKRRKITGKVDPTEGLPTAECKLSGDRCGKRRTLPFPSIARGLKPTPLPGVSGYKPRHSRKFHIPVHQSRIYC